MIWVIVLFTALVALFLSGFFSGSETGLYCVNRLRLQLAARRQNRGAMRISALLEDEQGALSTTLVGTNLANFAATSTVAYMFAELIGVPATHCEIYTVLILTPIVFVFGEVVPKNLFQRHADTLMLAGSRWLVWFDRLFRILGVVPALKLLASGLNRLMPGQDGRSVALGPRHRVAALLQDALAGQTHGEDRSDLVDRIFRLSETPLHAVMVPRNRVQTIAADADRRTLIRITRRRGHAVLPVHEAHHRQVVGLVKVDELLQSDDWKTVSDRLHPVMRLRPHDTVASAMIQLQRAGRSLAVITDPGGRLLGVVALKDLLAQVVGELHTEV